jgi:Pyruvate/2-oxoacid:ferredoxin oxidoreductase gamma subunit
LGKDEIKKQLEILGKNLYLVSASDICKEKLGSEVVSGVYLLGYAIRNNLMPLKEVSLVKAIKNIVPAKYQELNVKAAQLI